MCTGLARRYVHPTHTDWRAQGHSTIYEEKETYKLAIDWMLQSTLIWEPYQGGAGDEDGEGSFDRLFLPPNECRAGPMSGHASRKPFSAPTRLNSYYLPWIMNEVCVSPDALMFCTV